MGGYFFVNDDFQINSIKKDLNRRSDIKELMKSVGHSKMYALSKASFIHQLEEQGYKVEWNNDNILFILPNGKSYLNTELNPKADWFNVQTIEKQIHINLDRYIKNLMRQVHSTMDFVELLKSEQSNITGVTSSETMTKHDIEEILKDVELDFRSLNEYYDLKNDKTELQNAIWQCSRCSLSKDDFIEIVKEIGTIPEVIEASSTEEKLYSKASDIVLARCFSEIGLKAKALSERGNSADIVAESHHGYTLVADAKTFRLSRTAKNQKDFKISTLSRWRGMEHDFAVLVAPYFQYPNTSSQIYASSLSDKVCLLSWEHILFLLNQQVVEDVSLSLEQIWNAPTRIERDSKIAYADRMNCLFPYINKMVCDRIPISLKDFEEQLNICKLYIFERSNDEIAVLNAEIQKIEEYTKEQAIKELIKSRKLNEKISAILSYKSSL